VDTGVFDFSEEDLSNVYASQLFRYFLTEGIVVGNDLLLASDLNSCEKIINVSTVRLNV